MSSCRVAYAAVVLEELPELDDEPEPDDEEDEPESEDEEDAEDADLDDAAAGELLDELPRLSLR